MMEGTVNINSHDLVKIVGDGIDVDITEDGTTKTITLTVPDAEAQSDDITFEYRDIEGTDLVYVLRLKSTHAFTINGVSLKVGCRYIYRDCG